MKITDIKQAQAARILVVKAPRPVQQSGLL